MTSKVKKSAMNSGQIFCIKSNVLSKAICWVIWNIGDTDPTDGLKEWVSDEQSFIEISTSGLVSDRRASTQGNPHHLSPTAGVVQGIQHLLPQTKQTKKNIGIKSESQGPWVSNICDIYITFIVTQKYTECSKSYRKSTYTASA